MSDDIVRGFLVESNENLDLLDRELIQLEKEPTNRDTLASVFRTIHTIKGTCGFLGFTKLESVAHVGENLLSKMRDGELVLNPDIATALLAMVDAIRQMLGSIEADGNEGERDDEVLVQTLTKLLRGESLPALAIQPSSPPSVTAESVPCVRNPSMKPPGKVLAGKGATSPGDVSPAVQAQERGDPLHGGEILVERAPSSHETSWRLFRRSKRGKAG